MVSDYIKSLQRIVAKKTNHNTKEYKVYKALGLVNFYSIALYTQYISKYSSRIDHYEKPLQVEGRSLQEALKLVCILYAQKELQRYEHQMNWKKRKRAFIPRGLPRYFRVHLLTELGGHFLDRGDVSYYLRKDYSIKPRKKNEK